MSTIEEKTIRPGLCIGCGLCSIICPQKAINLSWHKKLTWIPQIDVSKCTNCSLCSQICPNTSDRISTYAIDAAKAGELFGLSNASKYFIAYDMDKDNRIRSASGGALNIILNHLLEKKYIDGVIASVPVSAPIGEPHYKIKIIKSLDELDNARSSHYYPLRYDEVLHELSLIKGIFAIIGTPCIIRGIKEKLPQNIHDKIKYRFCLVCSHNVTGQFIDCLAKQEGVLENEYFVSNLRDKIDGIQDANNFNNYFKLSDREIRRNRFQTSFTDMWRNYFFAQECCLYCPDFYGVDADLSVKDGWGTLSKDPLGVSLLIVRNHDLAGIMEQASVEGKLYLESCDADVIYNSQAETAVFKHTKIHDRIVWKPSIRRELIKKNYISGTSRHFFKPDSLQYWRFRLMMFLSNFFYSRTNYLPVRKIIKVAYFEKDMIGFLRKKIRGTLNVLKKILSPVKYVFKPLFCFLPKLPKKNQSTGEFRVLIAGGYGYKNTGDEAQLSVVISHWKNICPNSKITILSPDTNYTEKVHHEHSELAPRITLFNSDKNRDYGLSNIWFKWRFRWIKAHMLFLTWLFYKGLPLIGAYPHEVHLLKLIAQADVFHLSGGGYLTGMTLSRLWENMMLIRIADILDTPVILSGQTIGVFKDKVSKKLAYWGLSKAKLIYLRDPEGSIADIHSLGIKGTHIKATFDDALFCDISNNKIVDECLHENGLNNNDNYAIINVHFWGQNPSDSRRIMERCAEVCDYVTLKHNLRILFIPMHSSDIEPMKEVQSQMIKESRIINYNYDYRLTKGIISRAQLCITMKHHTIIFALGTGVPTISMVFDDYYIRKNHGAMKLFGQDKWIIDLEQLFSKEVFENMIDSCLDKRQEIKKEILSRLEDKREQDGEVIRRFIKQYSYDKKLQFT